MPLKAGFHKLQVSLAKPVPSSLLGYVASFFGYQPELLQPKMLASTAGNHCMKKNLKNYHYYVCFSNSNDL